VRTSGLLCARARRRSIILRSSHGRLRAPSTFGLSELGALSALVQPGSRTARAARGGGAHLRTSPFGRDRRQPARAYGAAPHVHGAQPRLGGRTLRGSRRVGAEGIHAPPYGRQESHRHRRLRQEPSDDTGTPPLAVAYQESGGVVGRVEHEPRRPRTDEGAVKYG
jgi:hypothetical protein